jgi:hypothetical protein
MKTRMTMNRSIIATATAFCLVLTACGSKELGRSKAAKLIKDKYYTQQMIENGAQTTQVAEMKDQVVGQSGSVFGIRGGGLPDLRNYEKAGWITLVVRRCQFNACAVDVSLTPKGAEESKGWKKTSDKVWMVPIFRREFIEVTGITSSKPSTAVAEFTSRWIPTDYGKELGAVTSAPEAGNANFRLYDDGWRLIQ